MDRCSQSALLDLVSHETRTVTIMNYDKYFKQFQNRTGPCLFRGAIDPCLIACLLAETNKKQLKLTSTCNFLLCSKNN